MTSEAGPVGVFGDAAGEVERLDRRGHDQFLPLPQVETDPHRRFGETVELFTHAVAGGGGRHGQVHGRRSVATLSVEVIDSARPAVESGLALLHRQLNGAGVAREIFLARRHGPGRCRRPARNASKPSLAIVPSRMPASTSDRAG